MKDKLLQIRVTEEEKKEMQQTALKEGHSSISAFILWLYRQFKAGLLKKGR